MLHSKLHAQAMAFRASLEAAAEVEPPEEFHMNTADEEQVVTGRSDRASVTIAWYVASLRRRSSWLSTARPS